MQHLRIPIEQAKQALDKAQRHYEALLDVEYLFHIQDAGFVEWPERLKSMADVMRLAEEGWLQHDGSRWAITAKGQDMLRYWSSPSFDQKLNQG